MLKQFSNYWWLWRVLAGVSVSFFLLQFLYTGIDFSVLKNYSLRENSHTLLLAAFLGLVGFAFQAIKWSYFFNLNISYSKRFNVFFNSVIIGHVLNTFLPFKAGEIAKPLHLSKTLSLNKVYVFSTCVADRTFDISILFILALVYGLKGKLLLHIHQFINFIVAFKLILLALVSLITIILLLLFFKRQFESLRRKITQHFLQLKENFKALTFSTISLIILFTILFWASTIFSNRFILLSSNLPESLTTWTVAVYMTVFAVFAYLIPSAPASLGTLNMAIVLALQYRANEISLNISDAIYQQILLCSILQYVISIVPDIVAMLWLLATSKDIKMYRNDAE